MKKFSYIIFIFLMFVNNLYSQDIGRIDTLAITSKFDVRYFLAHSVIQNSISREERKANDT
jgi:hypothetical protein